MIKTTDLFDYAKQHKSSEAHQIEIALLTAMLVKHNIVSSLETFKERNTIYSTPGFLNYSSDYVFCDHDDIQMGNTDTLQMPLDLFVTERIKIVSYTIKLRPIFKGGYYIRINRKFTSDEKDVGGNTIIWHTLNYPFPIAYAKPEVVEYFSTWELKFEAAVMQMGQVLATMTNVNTAALSLNNASNRISKTFSAENLQEILKNAMSGATGKLVQHLELALIVGSCAFAIRYYYLRKSGDLKLALFGAAVVTLMEGPNIVNSILEFFTPSDVPQMQTGIPDLSQGLESIFAPIFDIPKATWSKIYMSVASFDRFKCGLASIVTFITGILNGLCEYVFNARPISDTLVMAPFTTDEILKLCNEIDEFGAQVDSGELPANMTTYAKVLGLREACDRLLVNQKTNAAISVLSSRQRTLKALNDKLLFLRPGIAEERVEPVAVLFQGAPGTTKSKWMNKLGSALSSNGEAAYPRNFTADYWEGYVAQSVVTLDDFGQQRDVAGKDRSEYAEFIAMVTSAPYLLNIAAVEGKGRTYFKAKYVLATSNMREFSLQSIVDSGAVIRRFEGNVFRVVPKEWERSNKVRDSFCRKPDWTKFDLDDNGVAQIGTEDFEFIQVDLTTHTEIGRYTFEELVAFLKQQQKRKECIYEREMDIRKMIAVKTTVDSESDSCDLDNILMSVEKTDSGIDFEQTGDVTAYNKLSSVFKDNFDKVCELYNAQHGVAVNAAKSFSVACSKLAAAIMKRICYGKALFSDITAFLRLNFIYIKLKEKFSVDLRSVFKQYLVDNDGVFSRANMWKVAGAATVGTIGGLISMWESVDPEYQGAYNKPIPNPSHVNKPLVPHNGTAVLQAHDLADENGKTVYGSLFGRNLYYIVGDEFKFCNYALFVCDRWAILPLHWLTVQKKLIEESPDYGESRFEFRMVSNPGNRKGFFVSVNYLVQNYVRDDNLTAKDVGLIKFPEDMRIHKDIREHFPCDGDLKQTYDYVRRFSYTLTRSKGVVESIRETTVSRADRIENQLCVNAETSNYYTTYSLRMHNDKGMCGMPYVIMNPKLQKGKILGIHLAGAGNISFCNPIYREYFDSFIGTPDIDPLEEKAAEFQSNDVHKAMFYELGLSEKVNTTVKSDLRKSCLFETISDAITIPARLVPFRMDGQLVDPEVLSLERFNRKQNFQIDKFVLDECIKSEIDWYNGTNVSYSERVVYSIEDAVLGSPDDIFFKSITRKTSPGYPYVLTRKGKGRFEIFGDQPEFNLTTPKFLELQEEIKTDIANMVNSHIVPEIYFIDCLKDETVSFKKFNSGMTRVFSAGDIKGLILFRMYFGNFVTAMLKDRFTNGSSIGINPYSEEWETLMKRFEAKGNTRYNAGDFSAFDASQTSQILASMLAIIENHYVDATDDDRTIRRLLWNRAINSIHISKGKIYKWDGGLPSGWYLTAIVNSMYGRIAHKLCFYQALKVGTKAFWTFNSSVELSQHGDDSVFTVEPIYDEIFNEYTLTEYMANLGLKYTPENKESRSGEKRTKYDVNYLKRYWRFCPIAGRHVAPMKLDALLNQLNWTRKVNGDTITIDKANNVARELALHGEEIFNKYIPKINSALQERLQVSLSCTSFIQSLTDVLNYETEYFVESNMNFHTHTNSSDADYSSVPDVSNCNEVNEATFQSDDRVNPVSADFVDQDDAVVDQQSIIAPLKLGRFGSAFKNSGAMDIVRFLSKPVIIASSSFTTTDGPATFNAFDWSEPLFNSMYANKISGIYTINATLVLRLQVNANPMQQGMYYLCYVPFGGASDTNRQNEWYRAHRHSITQILQLPHARILLGSETEVTLSIPWRSAYNSYMYNPALSTQTLPGRFFLYPVVPLTLGTGGSTTVGYTLWANYTDIELGIVGSLQSDPTVIAQKKTANALKRDPIAEEQETKKVSTVLYTMGTIANSFGKIPLLSAFAAPLSYALSGAGMIADVLGFSKPNLIDPPVRAVRNNFPYMGTGDGVDGAEPLGLTRGNHVSMDPALLGTNVDEMSIAYLASISNYMDLTTWSTSDGVGAQLFSIGVTPLSAKHDTVDSVGVNVRNYGPLGWVGSYFNFWRGSLVFKITFIKTKFHSGRVVIAFQPADGILLPSPTSVTLQNTEFMYRNIVDIREKDEVYIEVPYVSMAPWLDTSSAGRTGYLSMHILDQLKAPDVVNSQIGCLVEMYGGKDLSFAGPRNFDYKPLITASFQSNEGVSAIRFPLTTIGDAEVPEKTSTYEEASIGEVIPSLRTLAKRGGFVVPVNKTAGLNDLFLILPFCNFWRTTVANTVTELLGDCTIDPYSHFSAVYALSRGGMRVRSFETSTGVVTDNQAFGLDVVNSAAGTVSTVITAQSTAIVDYISNNGITGNVVFNGAAPVSGVVIPQYTRTINRPSAAQFANDVAGFSYTNLETSPAQLRLTSFGGDASISTLLHRAIADDGNFGCFVSICPHFLSLV
jgi:hypothetical protein